MISTHAINVTGYAAATLTTISFVPQLLRVIRLRSAHEVSLGMFLIFTVGTALWLMYGALAHSLPVMVANAITFVLSLAILVLKLRFDRQPANAIQPGGARR